MAMYRIGTMIRETGQALERLGCRLVGVDAFQEDSTSTPLSLGPLIGMDLLCAVLRHRSVMNIGFLKPVLSGTTWVAPNASVVGNVTLSNSTSVWYGAVVKGLSLPFLPFTVTQMRIQEMNLQSMWAKDQISKTAQWSVWV